MGNPCTLRQVRRMTLSENLHWTPRAWLGHTRISVDQFTDAVDSRVSFSNTDRFTGGLGRDG